MARIILAEDDSSMRKFLARSMEKAGHEVIAVSNGSNALPMIYEGGYDLLLTDIVMPEMDGIELAQKAMAVAPHIKVMFITGFAAVALEGQNEAIQNTRVFSKPFHLKDILKQIDNLFAA